MPNANRIAPCLWFDNQAEEAARPAKASRVMEAMLEMKKLDIAEIERAAGRTT